MEELTIDDGPWGKGVSGQRESRIGRGQFGRFGSLAVSHLKWRAVHDGKHQLGEAAAVLLDLLRDFFDGGLVIGFQSPAQSIGV